MSEQGQGKERLTLKWGTLKGWDLLNEESLAILNEWAALGVSASTMCQNDSPEQKDILCRLIDILDGRIINDWAGGYFTKEEAKDYIRNYRS